MKKLIYFFLFSLSLSFFASAEPIQKGPDAVKARDDGDSPAATGSFTLLIKRKDYGLTATRLILDFGEKSLTREDIAENTFKVVDVNKSDDGIQNITGFSITDRQGYTVEAGRYVTIDLDFVMDPDSVTASYYIVTLNKDLGKYKKGSKFIQKGRTVRR
jgi:hypothetical protein